MTQSGDNALAARPLRVLQADTPGQPHCVVLPALREPADNRPPVRIFLGTDASQLRAQRVFFFSIERVRDPNREYRIYPMKHLGGFTHRHWRTGFTNYRYAIPTLAGGEGRAIYNDVAQIYLEDPAHLFDLPMAGHGYLAITPEDTSVMLLDCARMAPAWDFARARDNVEQPLVKQPLTQHAPPTTNLWGPLEPGWNTRDEEYADHAPRLLHYAALHQQPWQPRPDRYSYQPHPLADLWFGLEREADNEEYGPFTADTPSPWFAAALEALAQHRGCAFRSSQSARDIARKAAINRLLWCRPQAHQSAIAPLPVERITDCTLQTLVEQPSEVAETFDGVAVTDLLESLPGEDIPWLLDRLARKAGQLIYVGLHLSDARHYSHALDNAYWWHHQLRCMRRRHPHLSWHLDIRRGRRRRVEVARSALTDARQSDARPAEPPRVWLLTGVHHGDNAQLRLLAERLGWPVEEKPLIFRPWSVRALLGAHPTLQILHPDNRKQFAPPWPDIVLGIGRRSINVARWIQSRSGGHSQLYWLGRPRVPLHWFDLIVTTPQYGLPARSHIIHNLLPLNRATIDPATLHDWEARFQGLPRPWIGVMIGGATKLHQFAVEEAISMARRACELARREGGSLLISTSPRTPPPATRAFLEQLDVPHFAYDWQAHQGADNPHQAYLALCDSFIVSDDSASMMAETITTRQPTWLYPLQGSSQTPADRLLAGLHGWLCRRTRQLNARGIHRQQNWQGRFYDYLFTRGLVSKPRDLKQLGYTLQVRKLVHPLPVPAAPTAPAPVADPMPDELETTVLEIRQRTGERHWRE